jgi:hypothetical protein
MNFTAVIGVGVTSLLLSSCRSEKQSQIKSADALRNHFQSAVNIPDKINWRKTKSENIYPAGAVGWEAETSGGLHAEIVVNPADGSLVRATMHDESDYYGKDHGRNSITQESAIEIAERWISKVSSNGMSDLKVDRASYREDENEWIIICRRKEDEITYLEDQTWVVLRGDGSLENIKREMFASPPDKVSMPFPAAKAQEKAREYAIEIYRSKENKSPEALGIKFKLKSSGVYAVQPNSEEWLNMNSWPLPSSTGRTRLAYVFVIETEIPLSISRALWLEIEPWIDCVTGEVIGSRCAESVLLR